MRYLLVISFIIISIGCSKSPYSSLQKSDADKLCIAKFKPLFTSILYNTKIDVVGKHLSGLLLFKTMPDSSIRVVFTNEMGAKLFDFEYRNSGFKSLYCISQLNKKIVIRQLKEDIGYLIMDAINFSSASVKQNNNQLYFEFANKKTKTYYITDDNCLKLLRIENVSKNKKKIVIDLGDYKSGMPDSVNIAHQLFQFNISLKQIDR